MASPPRPGAVVVLEAQRNPRIQSPIRRQKVSKWPASVACSSECSAISWSFRPVFVSIVDRIVRRPSTCRVKLPVQLTSPNRCARSLEGCRAQKLYRDHGIANNAMLHTLTNKSDLGGFSMIRALLVLSKAFSGCRAPCGFRRSVRFSLTLSIQSIEYDKTWKSLEFM